MTRVSDQPKAAGCSVTLDDIPRICISLSCYCAQLGNGSTTAILGLAIPRFAESFQLPCSAFALLFVFSGVGYFAGVNCASWAMASFADCSRFLWLCSFSAVTAVSVFAMFAATDMWLLRALVFIQFIGVAGVDAFCTVSLGEMWGQRVQPWMQARSTFYAVGGMIPPLVLQRTDSMQAAVTVCALLCLSTTVGGILEWAICAGCTSHSSEDCEGITERTPLKGSEQSHIHSNTLGKISSSRQLESTELAALEELLVAQPHPVTVAGDSEHVEEIVHSVLSNINHDTEDLSSEADGAADSGSDKDVTLTYATAPIVNSLTHPPASDLTALSTGAEKEHNEIVADIVSSIALVPELGKNLLTVFIFLFCTFSASFVGWFPTFCAVKTSEGVYVEPGLLENVVSTYFFFMSWGCVASIPCSVWIPNRTLLRFHLVLIAIGVCLLEVSLSDGILKYPLLASSAIMGYGVSSIFALTMTMANDYGFTTDADATTRMLMGGSIGSSLVPMAVGYCMKSWGPEVLPIFVLVLGLGMGAAYLSVHRCLTTAATERKRVTKESAVRGDNRTSCKHLDIVKKTISASNLERHHALYDI